MSIASLDLLLMLFDSAESPLLINARSKCTKILEKMVLVVTQAHHCGTMPAGRKPYWSMAQPDHQRKISGSRRWSLELKKLKVTIDHLLSDRF